MSEERQEAILAILNSHRDVHPGMVTRLLLDELVEQAEQIRNLQEAVQQQAEKLEGKTAALARRIDRQQRIHGA